MTMVWTLCAYSKKKLGSVLNSELQQQHQTQSLIRLTSLSEHVVTKEFCSKFYATLKWLDKNYTKRGLTIRYKTS